VVIVPEFRGDEDVGARDEALGDCALYALPCFGLVLVVVGTVEEAVA
jgi:hypothetical protein